MINIEACGNPPEHTPPHDAVRVVGFAKKYEELKLDEHLQTSLRPSPYEFYRYMDA